ncbi:MAG: cupin domain-containing protein [Sphingomonadales bacterium]|nr:cupin domain-containing protein [Sphingomonadales bacterium]
MTAPRANLFDPLPDAKAAERFTQLLARPGLRIERIVTRGQTTPVDQPYDQPHDEWVLLLAGAARLWLEGDGEVTLAPGDHLLIPAGVRHRVTWTPADRDTVWLALHFA